jgi:hypothetical protein
MRLRPARLAFQTCPYGCSLLSFTSIRLEGDWAPPLSKIQRVSIQGLHFHTSIRRKARTASPLGCHLASNMDLHSVSFLNHSTPKSRLPFHHPSHVYKQSNPPRVRLSREPTVWYIGVLIVYAVATAAAFIVADLGASVNSSQRVLRTGSARVDQFYSGLVLSAVLAPVGLVLRKLGIEISLLHPFAVASSKPISVPDLDRISDPGPLALRSLSRYSWWLATVQSVLMTVGWLLVPVGTLAVATDTFVPPTSNYTLVPMALRDGGVSTLHGAMNSHKGSAGPFVPALDNTDGFLAQATAVFRGNLVLLDYLVPEVPQEIGTMPQPGITYQPNVTYEDILTYTWTLNC